MELLIVSLNVTRLTVQKVTRCLKNRTRTAGKDIKCLPQVSFFFKILIVVKSSAAVQL